MATHTWTIDPVHSAASFSLKHMLVATVRGHMARLEGKIEFDEAAPERSSIDPHPEASINTGVEARDNHLRSADFFDTERFPYMVFKSSDVTADGDKFQIRGDLTILAATHPVVLETTFEGIVPGAQGRRLAAFEAHTRVKRADWGLTWNKAIGAGGWLIGDEIRIDLDIEAVEASPPVEVASPATLGPVPARA
jgi:polyisoprenoid-binding protein YceI